MHEKDLELAKLLLGKLSALEAQQARLSADLSRAQDELERQWQMRDERAKYLDILSRAAELLNRADLREELPETTDLEQQVTRLEDELSQLSQEAAQHRELVESLNERAPQLVSAARSGYPPPLDAAAAEGDAAIGEEPAMDEVAEPPGLELVDAAGLEPDGVEPAPTTAVTDEVPAGPEEPEPAEPARADDAAEAPAPATENEAAAPEQTANGTESETLPGAPATDGDGEEDTALDHGIDPEISLSRFNLSNLKRREAFTHGRGAAYIIDASSVLERVPNYDHYVRGIELEEAREELIRDFDILGRELSGSFHLVFSAWFQYATRHGNNVSVEFSTGPDEGTKDASDRRLRELVFEMTAKLRPVCVITGDRELLESVRGQGIHPILLGEFFRA